MHGARVVHGLIGHSGGHRPVADDGDHIVAPALEIPRHGHAEAGRDRRGRMRGPEGIVLALGPLGEAREASTLTQRTDPVPAAREDLVRVGLVADIPDQAVLRGVEHVVQRHRQLDHPEPRAQMPSRHGDGADRFRPQLVRDLLKAVLRQLTEVSGRLDGVEERCGQSFFSPGR